MTRLLLATLILLLAGCAAQPRHVAAPEAAAAAAALTITPGPGRTDNALYVALGELPGIERLVDAMLVEVTNDLRINFLFEGADAPYLRARLIEQICAASGGPCTYTGLSMEEAHSGQGVTAAQFGHFVEDLQAAMAKVGLSEPAQSGLLGALAPMQPEVVGQ